MKLMIVAAIAASLAIPAYAQAAPHKPKINCGWPHPDPACSAMPPVSPAPATPTTTTPAVTTNPIEGVIQALIEAKTAFIADVNAANVIASTPWPPAPGTGATFAPTFTAAVAPATGFVVSNVSASGGSNYVVGETFALSDGVSTDTYSQVTVTGVGLGGAITGVVFTPGSYAAAPASVTEVAASAPGQTSIDPVAAACYPTLASWAAGLSLPVAPTAPNGGSGLVTVFEDLRVTNIVAQNVIQQINSVGVPNNLKIACGGLITDTVTQGGVIAGEVGSFATMLAKFIPLAALAKHHVAFLAPKA